MNNDFTLIDLKKLKSINGFIYDDIPEYFMKKFDKTNIRVVVLSDETTLDIRQEIFTRINTSGVSAKPIEVRRGKFMKTPFMDFIRQCADDELFIKLCPVSETLKKRYEGRENSGLTITDVDWLDSEEFKVHTTSHASNSPNRVVGRIEYVRDMLLRK